MQLAPNLHWPYFNKNHTFSVEFTINRLIVVGLLEVLVIHVLRCDGLLILR